MKPVKESCLGSSLRACAPQEKPPKEAQAQRVAPLAATRESLHTASKTPAQPKINFF